VDIEDEVTKVSKSVRIHLQQVPIYNPFTGRNSYYEIYRTEDSQSVFIDIEDQLKELKEFFDKTPHPTVPIQLDSRVTIDVKDYSEFVECFLGMLAGPTPRGYLKYLWNLQKFRDIVKKQQIT
jgi:hypothetical protein